MAPFQDNNCLTSAWKVSHGTPEIGTNGNNHFIHIWSGDWLVDGDNEGEGIFYDCELFTCIYYNISLRISSTSTIDKIYFYAASGLQHKEKNGNEWSPESEFYKVPDADITNAYLIHSITNFNSGLDNWVNITLPTFAPPSRGMKLWIFSEDKKTVNSVAYPDLLFIDDITDGLAGSSSTCEGEINFLDDNNPIPPFTKANKITASISPKNTSTEFIGGNKVRLKPGFRAKNNFIFRAGIIPCTTENNCPENNPFLRTSNKKESFEDATQVKNNIYEQLKIYPNPFKDEFNVNKLLNEKITEVKLIEVSTGREIGFSSYEDLGSSIKFKLSAFYKGTFMFLLKTKEKTYISKIIAN